ncbi:hypothetical protein [Dokdonella soli]|uniref:DUF4175 family protein n=1 Tax=Dokdonella soli TaxID=529810 RepID=A0ABN1IJZ3_9GAMM
MSVEERIEAIRHAASRRRLAIALGCAAAPVAALIVLAARTAGTGFASAAALAGAVALVALARRASRSIDDTWIARRLDSASPVMEDSAALLFDREAALSNLQRLQQARLRTRFAGFTADLRPAWPARAFAASALLALVILALAVAWPAREHGTSAASDSPRASERKNATAIAHAELAIEAPAYTRVPARSEAALETKAPEGAHLRWRLRFDPLPQAVTLQFHDGSRVALVSDGADWIGERVLTTSSLYRIALDGVPALADDRLYRLDAIADQPPEIRVIQPAKTLTLLEAQQKTWDLAFEASDDYAIARADLSITLAQGTGENIAFKEKTVALTPALTPPSAPQTVPPSPAMRERDGREPPVTVRYSYRLDLAALGLSMGDDVIVRIAVGDNREPTPNTTRSASFILRWPVDASSESAGLEGIVQKTMPAYFRSQRQIIIDSEALLADKPSLDDTKFLARSDALGVDQKILRLRYGQFLGEESETHAEQMQESPHAAHDAGRPTQADALAAAHEAQERELPTSTSTKFGEEGNTLAEYGHVHDIAEAATLLDPDTKATLKSALAEMWQAELHLRQGRPDEALPYEHRALEFIKQVQQSTRIYLARVGLELPAPDETRRLSGDRKGLIDRTGTLGTAEAGDMTIAELWRTLADGGTPDWNAAETWIHAHEATLPDALGVLAALDTARRDPACADCRAQLGRLLWPLLPVPAAGTAPRATPDAAGRAYLDALRDAAAHGEAR